MCPVSIADCNYVQFILHDTSTESGTVMEQR